MRYTSTKLTDKKINDLVKFGESNKEIQTQNDLIKSLYDVYKTRSNTYLISAYENKKMIGTITVVNLADSNGLKHSAAAQDLLSQMKIDQSDCATIDQMFTTDKTIKTDLLAKAEEVAVKNGFKYFLLFCYNSIGLYNFHKEYFDERFIDTGVKDPAHLRGFDEFYTDTNLILVKLNNGE